MVPLASGIVETLRRLPRAGFFVIPGRKPGQGRYDLRKPWKRIRKAAGIEDVNIHDIRRTFGLEISLTAGLHVASKLLRHADVRVTEKVYAPLGIDELRAAAEARSKVLPFRAKDEEEG